ncbi:hypothetical protein ACVK00_006509, partial [Burkholderia sp. PvR073]
MQSERRRAPRTDRQLDLAADGSRRRVSFNLQRFMAAVTSTPIQSILIANRSEISIRVMRAAAELNIRTVA